MTFSDFVIKYTGVKVDFDGCYGAQCVDLPRMCWKEVYNIKEHTGGCATSGGAKDLFLDYDKMPLEKKYFKKVTSNFKAGDALVWSSTDKNPFGHTALFVGTFDGYLVVFEQDGYKQDGAKITLRSKKNLLGALRVK